MVVAAVQVAGLVEGEGVEKPVAGLEEALHVRELQAVAVALHLLDVHIITHGRVLRELQLVAARSETSGQTKRDPNSPPRSPLGGKTPPVTSSANPEVSEVCGFQMLISYVILGKSGLLASIYPSKKAAQ